MALFRYFKRKGNSEKLPININCIFQLRISLRYSIDSNNSKKRGQYGKYTPEQKAMIGKRAAEHGVVANLCIPDCFILVVTSYHSYICTRDVVSTWPDPNFFYHESLQIRASTKILPPPPRKIPAIWYMIHFVKKNITGGQNCSSFA